MMAKLPDLERMTPKDLHALSADIDKAVADSEMARKSAALKSAEEAAKKFGFTLSELTRRSGPKSKYKIRSTAEVPSPREPCCDVTGRGRRPAWIAEGLASGKSVEDFAI